MEHLRVYIYFMDFIIGLIYYRDVAFTLINPTFLPYKINISSLALTI